jgi:8-oxo-dGTP pyrophosphatase MutT (NUDIX family)
MGSSDSELARRAQPAGDYRPTWGEAAVDRVRCVLRHEGRFLLADHGSGRRRKAQKWGLAGGRILRDEPPLTCIKRELYEELRLRVAKPVEIGDWWHCEENYRVFGADLARAVRWFDERELRALAWLTYAEVAALAADGLLHKGFELEAIGEYRRRFPG